MAGMASAKLPRDEQRERHLSGGAEDHLWLIAVKVEGQEEVVCVKLVKEELLAQGAFYNEAARLVHPFSAVVVREHPRRDLAGSPGCCVTERGTDEPLPVTVALGLRRDGQPVDADYVRVRGERAALDEA